MQTKKLRKWVVSSVTIALLSAGGYKLTDWNEETGWGIVDTTEAVDTSSNAETTDIDTISTQKDTIVTKKAAIVPQKADTIIIAHKPIPKKREDTLRFADSTQLAEFGQFGKHGFGSGAVFK